MRTTLVLLLTIAPALLAEEAAPRAVFPDDYKAPACASQMNGCVSFDRWSLASVALKYRGMEIHQDWIDAHYDEMIRALEPYCRKAAACFAAPPNEWTFCNDLLQPDTLKVCDRFPAGSDDREQCGKFTRAYWFGHDRHSADQNRAVQACVTEHKTDTAERTMDVWMTPSTIGRDYDGTFKVFAIDTDTHVPVMATIAIEGQDRLRTSGGPGGRPTTSYTLKWPLRLNRAPNAAGHRDVVAPMVVVTAAGFKTVTFPIPFDIPKMIVEMNGTLKRGRNTFTVTARDAATGEPVEARVMAGDVIVGDTNKPLELEWKKGEKRPEIWVTSLFDRYSDVVVAKGE